MNEASKNVIYKVVSADQWEEAEKTGEFLGAVIDLSDGYIHFSSPEQVQETVAKHFAGQTNLLLVAVDPDKLGEALKWEPSRGGALFPHLYGPLSMESVISVVDLPLGKDGQHLFPSS